MSCTVDIKRMSRSRSGHQDEARTRIGRERDAAGHAGHGEVEVGVHGEPPRRESGPWPIPARRGAASESRRCARARQSCEPEELGGDGLVAVNFRQQAETAGSVQEGRKRRDGRLRWA